MRPPMKRLVKFVVLVLVAVFIAASLSAATPTPTPTLTASPTATATPTQVICASISAPIAQYGFNIGQETNDLSGNGNNLTMVGTVPQSTTIFREGNASAGPTWGGTNLFTVPSGAYIEGLAAFTVSCWYYNKSFSANQGIYSNYGASQYIALCTQTGSPNLFGLYIQANNLATGTLPSADNAWHRMTGVYDEGTSTIYWDGTQIANSSAMAAPTFTATGSQIGSVNGNGFWLYPTTYIDDFRIYNCALTSGQVAQLANLPAPCPPNCGQQPCYDLTRPTSGILDLTGASGGCM